MRKFILTATAILAMVIMVSINTASAEERHIIFEMGESGQTISFPMTDAEIAAISAENATQVHGGKFNSEKTAPRIKIYEMGESGQIVSFLMTQEEIAAEDAEKRRISMIRRKGSVDDKQTKTYELAESGIVIEFPEPILEDHTVNIAKLENQ